jgi:DNA replication protein DnaC
MKLTELDPALRKLRLSGMADHLEMRLLEAQKSSWAPIDLVSVLVQDELQRRQDRLLERRIKQARFRDRGKSLDGFDFAFNPKIDRALVFELATGRFLAQAEDGVLLGPPGSGKSHLVQAIGLAVIHQGHRVAYREVHTLLEELADATLDGVRKEYLGPPPPRISSSSSCVATSAPARWSPRTAPSRTGDGCSATPPP